MHPRKPYFSHANRPSSALRLSDGQTIYLLSSLLTASMKRLVQLLTVLELTPKMMAMALTPVERKS